MLSITSLLIALIATADVSIISAEDEVRSVQAERIRATIESDIDVLEELYADDLVYTHSDGRVDDRLVLLNALRSGFVDYQQIDIVEQKVRVVGKVAIFNGTADFRVQAGDQLNVLTLRFTSIYIYRVDGWQFSSWHSSQAPNAS